MLMSFLHNNKTLRYSRRAASLLNHYINIYTYIHMHTQRDHINNNVLLGFDKIRDVKLQISK